MADHSTIEWTDATWNPVRGCTKVSAGCKHCYAETFAERWRGIPGHPYEQGFDLRLVPEALELPLKWKKGRRVFVNSMSDLFHEAVPSEFIEDVVSVMRACPQHRFQLLTKRSARLRQLGTSLDLPENVWLGVSVEDERQLQRIHDLVTVPAAVRFLSLEPLLGPLDKIPLEGVHWVIVGGESGPGARPIDPAWVRGIREQCTRAGVAFFFKQWGGVRKKLAGRELDGRTWDDMPMAVQPETRLRVVA